jgi:hypothetical protein
MSLRGVDCAWLLGSVQQGARSPHPSDREFRAGDRRDRIPRSNPPSAFDKSSSPTYPWCRASSQPQKVRFAPDSTLEGTGFEPSVPLLQKALLGVANRDVGTISGTHLRSGPRSRGSTWGPPMAVPFAAGPMVRILFPPAASQERTRTARAAGGSGGPVHPAELYRQQCRGRDRGLPVGAVCLRLQPIRSRLAGKSQSLKGAPLRNAPGFRASTGT